MRNRIAYKIKWDTDGECIPELPSQVTIPNEVKGEDVADYLSDMYGFCVESFLIK